MTDFVYCAGEHARVVLDSVDRRRKAAGRDRSDERELVLVDDDESRHGTEVGGREVVGGRGALDDLDGNHHRGHVALGDRRGVRLDIAESIEGDGYDLFTVVDPDATISETASVEAGAYVNAGSYVGPQATVGKAVVVDSLANVSHDTALAPGVTVTPRAAIGGGAVVERNAYVGIGATVLDHVRVGEGAVVGAGAVVVDDVPPETTVVGVPAEPLEGRRDDERQREDRRSDERRREERQGDERQREPRR